MNVMHTLRKVGRGIKEVPLFLSSGKRKARKQELYEIIEAANLVEQLFESEVWRTVIDPFVQAEKDKCINEMANHHKRYPEDVGKFTQVGILQANTGLIAHLKSILNQKPNAEQELELLGRSEKEETE